LINLPIAVVVVLVAARHVPETRDADASGKLDVVGAASAALGLALVIYALTEGPGQGWTAATITSLLGGIAVLAGFLFNEAHVRDPMMPLSLFRNKQFTGANLATLVVYAALAGALFLLPLALQRVSGFSPVQAGSSLLPVTVVMLLLSARMGRLAQRIGPRRPMTIGPIVAACGMALFARIDASSTYLVDVLPAVIIFGLGLSLTVAPLTATVLAAAPAHEVGVASAVNNDVARTAGLLAVAVLPGLAGIDSAAYADPSRLATGFHHAVLIAAVLCALGGLLSWFVIDDAVLERGEKAPLPGTQCEPGVPAMRPCGVAERPETAKTG
jgi:predicted MFS family arabinose efflux permease